MSRRVKIDVPLEELHERYPPELGSEVVLSGPHEVCDLFESFVEMMGMS